MPVKISKRTILSIPDFVEQEKLSLRCILYFICMKDVYSKLIFVYISGFLKRNKHIGNTLYSVYLLLALKNMFYSYILAINCILSTKRRNRMIQEKYILRIKFRMYCVIWLDLALYTKCVLHICPRDIMYCLFSKV